MMRRVPREAVLRTEYPFCTGNACFLHRMPLKMRRVPQEPVLSTECVFRTVGGPLRYRIPQSQNEKALPVPNTTNGRKEKALPVPNATTPKKEKALPAASITNTRKEKVLPATNATTARKEVFPLTQRGVRCEKRSPPHRGKQKENDIKIVLFPIWGAMWGSNPRHPEPQSGALPTELIAPCQFGATKVQRFFGIPREYSKKELSLCDLNKNRIREYVKRD